MIVRSEPRSLGEGNNKMRAEKEDDDNLDSHSRTYPQMPKGMKHERQCLQSIVVRRRHITEKKSDCRENAYLLVNLF